MDDGLSGAQLFVLHSSSSCTSRERPLSDETALQVHPRAVTLWRLGRLLRLLIVGLPVSIVVATAVGARLGFSAGLVVAGAMLTVQFMSALAWPSLQYEHLRYSVREHDLLVQRGVIFRHWSSVPHDRIQHVDTRQGPLERALGLATVAVYTASGVSADSMIPGLAEAEANALRDRLSRRGGDDGV